MLDPQKKNLIMYLRARVMGNNLTGGYEKIIYYSMKSSRSSRNPGMVPVGLFLLLLLTLAWIIPCHADVQTCEGDCAQSECCGGHSMPLLSAVNPAPIIGQYISPYHAVEVQPTPRIFASSIFRPPRA
jgi:hypothetical protein